ncbi:MAG: flavodoxin [Phocaeicola dorei]|nr:flavodoxin [Phocaeicola dorei]
MKRILSLVMLFTSFCTFSACAGNGNKANGQQQNGSATGQSVMETQSDSTKTARKVLVAFFSHTGENYNVGYIEKGNTHIIAEMIAGEMGGELFEIETVKAYPKEYRPCIDVAKQEKESNARPELKADITTENYDVIFIGYPNWWEDMPMAVYTFIEKHKWKGKTVIPFCTHEGSGLSKTQQSIEKACVGSTVLQGLAVKGSIAQSSREEAKKSVQSWIKKLNF